MRRHILKCTKTIPKKKKPVKKKANENVKEQESIKFDQNNMYVPNIFGIIRENNEIVSRELWIEDEIESKSAIEIIRQLMFYSNNKEPITIFINTPGGLTTHGFAIIDVIEKLKQKKIIIKTVCVGMAASMGAIILASGTKGYRYSFPNSTIMLHQVSVHDAGGNVTELENTNKYLKLENEKAVKHLVKYTKKTKKEIDELISYDNYMSPQLAKRNNIIDKIGVVL